MNIDKQEGHAVFVGVVERFDGVSLTLVSLFLGGKRNLRPAMAAMLIEGLERAFIRKGSRLGTAFLTTDGSD